MLRFTLLALTALLVCIFAFSVKVHNVRAHHVDAVSSVETFMAAR